MTYRSTTIRIRNDFKPQFLNTSLVLCVLSTPTVKAHLPGFVNTARFKAVSQYVDLAPRVPSSRHHQSIPIKHVCAVRVWEAR